MPAPPVVVPHASFDSLLASLSRGWIGGGRSLEPQPVVIPSIPFSDHLQLRIAHRFGVCMGIDFLTPQDLILRATGPHVESAWSSRHLAWRILPFVADYAASLGVADPSSRDRFALAGLLADQFDQYGHFRPEIIEAWLSNKPALPQGAPTEGLEAEKWQRELWRKLRAATDQPHPAEQFRKLRTDRAFHKRLAAAFPRLLVLGSGVVDPLFMQVLALLAEAGGEVEMHVLLPSLEFLGDLRTRQALPHVEQDPETIATDCGHPLLESMGRQSIGAFQLLEKLDENYEHWPPPGEPASGRGRLLERLQDDIRNLRPPLMGPVDSADCSVRVHSCFGPRREMEVLKDEILRAFRDFPDLRPEEIHIVTPSIEMYAPLVPAVLEQGRPPLAIRLMELPAGGRDAVIEAVLALLEMARGGRYEASWLMELLQLDAVRNALAIGGDEKAVEALRAWIRNSGVTRGLDVGDDRPGTWGFARDRLIAGRWLGTDDSIKYPDGSFVLPVAAQLSGDEALRDRFVMWFSALEEILREWEAPGSAADWERRLKRACATLLAGDVDAALAMQPHREFLQKVETDEAVDAGTIFDWLEAESREAGRRSRVSGRIPFGRLKHLQNIPCRVLAMVGMQDGAFPGQSRPPAWDLLRKAPRIWDRNVRTDDRQLFLDGLLTPRDRLIITASTRNVRTKKTEPFSSCVDELLRVTTRMGASREDLVVEHRLQPFAADYFNGKGPAPRSFNAGFAQVANELKGGSERKLLPFWKPGEPFGVAFEGEVAVSQLIGFWKNPAKAFLKAQGIFLPGDEEDDEALDRADVVLGNLHEWKLKNAIIDEVASGTGDLARTEAVFRSNRGLPPGHLGTSVWNANVTIAAPMGSALQELLGERIAAEVCLSGGPKIVGTLQLTRAGDRLLAYRLSEFQSARSYLEPWIYALLAAARGTPLPSALLDPVGLEIPKERPAIPEEEARSILGSLVAGFFEGQVRPLCYAPATSHVLVKTLQNKGWEEALAAAVSEWEKDDRGNGGGEGSATVAQWAWRDRNPFEEVDDWQAWAARIAEPLRAWGKAE